MSIVSINEEFQPNKYLIVSQQKDPETTITTRLIISDTRANQINLLTVEKGPQGERGPVGPSGLPGKDGLVFDVLSVSSGGTNNTSFSSGYIIYYDGHKLASSLHSVNSLNSFDNNSKITGVIASAGLSGLYSNNNTVIDLSVALGDGLFFDSNNAVAVDDTIARVSQLSLGNIPGTLPINKGGTNNSFFSQNRLIYFDGTKFRSYPIETGRFLLNGNTSVEIVAGSGLIGGGTLNVPNGSVVLNIPESADIIIEDNLLRLSNTGEAGIYSKVITDAKGRVVSGSSLTPTDIINILGYTPWNPNNDGAGSFLDADLLDAQHGSFYRNAANITGTLDINVLPSAIASPGLYTKVAVNTRGLIEGVYYADQQDIISSLGYTPLSTSGGTITNNLNINQNLNVGGELEIYDNLPMLAVNSTNILPSAPRGISFKYGGLYNNKTGILAYYPADNELRLITNIFSMGSDINGGAEDNQQDINGGNAESIFIVDNVDGDQSTVLLRHIADTLYVKTTTEQNINGFKTFLNGIAVNDQIVIYDRPNPTQPPLNVGSNNLVVTNLNADLLDGNHGNFYRNAANVTGSFNYNNVKFDHIQGTNNFIPKFSDPLKNPAGKITDSSLYQDNLGNIRVVEDQNLAIGGDSNNLVFAENSLAVGQNNVPAANNVAAIGYGNNPKGDNSLALNYRSKTDENAPNSIAAGSHGSTWLPNQIAVGGHRLLGSNNNSLEHSQHSTTMMYMAGAEAHASWRTLEPMIPIPRNKTMTYDVELLISKVFGTGVAHFHFSSGIVKNATFRNPNNLVQTINLTSHPQISRKISGFNNSQIKTHFHSYELGNTIRVQQNIDVTAPPIRTLPMVAQNVSDYYYYKPKNSLPKTGIYEKLNDGTLILDIDKPTFSGYFNQNGVVPGLRVLSPDHKMIPGSLVNLQFKPDSVSGIPILNGDRKVTGADSESFYIELLSLSGSLSFIPYSDSYDIATIVIDQDSLLDIDAPFRYGSSAYLAGTTISGVTNGDLLRFLRPGMTIKIKYNNTIHNRVVTGIDVGASLIFINNSIFMSENSNQIVNGSVNIYSIEYTYYLFKIADRVFVNNYDGTIGQFFGNFITKTSGTNFQIESHGYITGNNAQPTGYFLNILHNSGIYERLDFDHRPSIAVDLAVSKQFSYRSGVPVVVHPLFFNTGTVILNHKQHFTGSYSTINASYNKYQGIYHRLNEGEQSTIRLFNQQLEPISLPFAPVSYTLTTGFGDQDNDKFYISESRNKYFIHTKQILNYELQDTYSIRLKAQDHSEQYSLEKNVFIYLNDKHQPYVNIQSLPVQSAVVLQPFTYTLPHNLFIEEESGGPITLSATLKNWPTLPSWLSFYSHNGMFSGTPSGCQLGPHTIRIVATNASGYMSHIDLRLQVVDPQTQTLSYYNNSPLQQTDPAIRNILLSNYTIDENIVPSSIICSLSCEGSYQPFLNFRSASNTFSGIFRDGSRLIESMPVVFTGYPSVHLTGTPKFLATGSIVSSAFNQWGHIGSLQPSTKVTHVYKPTIFSGTPLLDSDTIIFDNTSIDYNYFLYTGIRIFGNAQYFDPQNTIKSWNYYSFKINTSILKEDEDLLWTENNDIITHNDPRQTINGLDAENTNNLFNENRERLITEDQLKVNTIWSSGYNQCPHGDLLSGKILLYNQEDMAPDRNTYHSLKTEDNNNLFTEYNEQLLLTSIFSRNMLSKLNPPRWKDLKITKLVDQLNSVVFREPQNNTVMAIYDLGLDHWAELLTEDDETLISNTDETIISDSFFDHGSRITLSNNYEIIESKEVYKDNGRLGSQTDFEYLLTEDDQPMVHDYAITSKKGQAYLLFPGENSNINLYYPELSLLDDLEDYSKDSYYTIGSLIPFSFESKKYFIEVDKPYTGQSASGFVVYSGSLPETSNYTIGDLQQFQYLSPTGDCIFGSLSSGTLGFEVFQSGMGLHYVTGLVDFYTEAGTGIVELQFNGDHNMDSRYDNRLYLHQFTKTSIGNSAQPPKNGIYKKQDIFDITSNTCKVYNRFLLPSSGIYHAGTFAANIDRNHGYTIKSSEFLNHIPIRFDNVKKSFGGTTTDNVLRPKNSLFDILNISGNKIYVNDSKNYLLKEVGRPDYFEQPVVGRYTTNGLAFSGSVFYDNPNIYDLRYDLYTLEKVIKRSTFEYDYAGPNSRININLPSGSVRPFDDVIVRFPTGVGYDTNPVYKLIDTHTVVTRSGLFEDLEPLKDDLLLESSASFLQPSYTQKISFNTSLANIYNNIKGTCDIDLKIEHRLQSGYNINYTNSPRISHTILSIQSGFSFSGFIPRYNNVISTDIRSLLSSEHIGFASIFHSGSIPLLSGGRILREANQNDVGYADYYFVGASGLSSPKTFFSGVGSTNKPYYETLKNINTTRSYDFLYLGQNSNLVRFYGDIVASGANDFVIYKETLQDQINIMKLAARNISSGVSPVFSIGNHSGNIDCTFTANRFDKFTILIRPHQLNKADLHTHIINEVDVKPLVLDSSSYLNDTDLFYPYLNPAEPSYVYLPNPDYIEGPINYNVALPQYIPVLDPEYSIFKPNNYHVLPFARTSNKYCDNAISRNMPFFFNGNTIVVHNFNVPRIYSQQYDEFKLLSFNNTNISGNSYTSKYITKIDNLSVDSSFTGVVSQGQLSLGPRPGSTRFPEIYEDRNRYNTVLGVYHNQYLPHTGIVSLVKSTSGNLTVLDYNNIYYHTYGGSTALWPMDTSGVVVAPIQTGVYTVVNNPSTCASGTLCVIISGFNNYPFTGIPDITNRATFGQYPNVVSANNTIGYVRPYGANKRFYFDFTDGFAEINGLYYINDLINPTTLAISIPYREDFLGRKGLVYLIDSHQNIKSHLNPNIDNQFIVSNGSTTKPEILDDPILNYYDNTTKRWKHIAHLKSYIPYTGYNISFNNSPTRFLSINPAPIQISSIEYKFGIDDRPFQLLSDNNLYVPTNETALTLRITTVDGDQKLLDQYTPSMPKVDISGFFDYTIETNQPTQYRYHGSGWILGANITLPKYNYDSFISRIKVKDLTGSADRLINIHKKVIPTVTPFSTSYAVTNSSWSLGFDVKGLNLYDLWSEGDIGFVLENTPTMNYGIKYIATDSIVFTGVTPSTTGNYSITMKVRDFTTEPYSILSSGTGLVSILNNYAQQPPFSININNLQNTYYFDLSKSTGLMILDIPAKLGPSPEQVTSSISQGIEFSTDADYRFQIISNAYDPDLERFQIIAKPIRTGDFNYVDVAGRYTNQTISIAFKQPIYDTFGNYSYITYNRSVSFDTVFYQPVSISKTVTDSSLVFALDQPWFVQFDVLGGATAHNPALRPRVKIHNAPNLGSYETYPIEYNLDLNYDNINHKWSATASAKKNFFGKYVYNTGIYPLFISVHDGLFDEASDSTTIQYVQKLSLKNIQNVIYAVPNNEFFANVDLLDLDDTYSTSRNIIGSISEPSVQINSVQSKHDTDLDLWQYGIKGQKFTDSYDARIVVDNNYIAVQCKGLGRDKVMAAARLDMVELESTELAGLPLTITGIAGYNPIEGTKFSQGAQAWNLQFTTIGGLADHRYPPTIVLENMPTFCNGFNPFLSVQDQCIPNFPVWNSDDMGGSWTFTFSGVPSCTLLGRKDFSITAIDTNTSLPNPYLPDTDSIDYFFIFDELTVQNNRPNIVDAPNYPQRLSMKPLCGVKYQQKLLFGPGAAPLCGTATGIKTIYVSGSLPSGLTYSVFFPGVGDNTNPEPPYSNLGSGHLIIEGYPLTFASGQKYPQELRLIVTDARNLSTSRLITFTDDSTPNDPNISLRLFFDSAKPVLSPKSGLAPIVGYSTYGYRPAPAAYDLVCDSLLPHSKCTIENLSYIGNNTTNTNIKLITSPGSLIINNSEIYIQFNNDSEHPLNDTYKVFKDNNELFINPGVTILPITGHAQAVIGSFRSIDISNFESFFNGTPDTNFNKCILGAGSLIRDITQQNDNSPLGLGGLLVPTITGALTGMNVFAVSDNKLAGLSLIDLDNNSTNNYSAMRWTNCWETGYLRISGIILPPIHVEIPDPPPALDFAPFSFNGQVYALATRLVFGDNEAQRLLIENQRRGRSLQYTITDLFSGNKITAGTVSSFSSFDTPVLNSASGTVYSVSIKHQGDTFPTYDYGALPYAASTYLWVHKGDNLVTAPSQTSFPPVYPLLDPGTISVINDMEDEDPNGTVMRPVYGLAVGGYVSEKNAPWSSRSYKPIISGIIQKALDKTTISGSYAYSYSSLNSNGALTLTIPISGVEAGYRILLSVYRLEWNNTLITPPYSTGFYVSSEHLTSPTTLTIPINSGTQPFNGVYTIEHLTTITGYIPETNSLAISHNNLPFVTGDTISLDQSNYVSTSLYFIETGGSLTITSGDNTTMYITNSDTNDTSWYTYLNWNKPVSALKIFDDNIKIMPYNTVSDADGRYIFQITGRSNVLNGDYIYKICTMENKNMPVFLNNQLIPKKYYVNYSLYINKPIKIIDNTISKTGMGSNWTISFRISGGSRPVYNNSPDIQVSTDGVNFGYCGFTRKSTSTQLKDAYDATNDQLVVELKGNNSINWGIYDRIYIKVSDFTGTYIASVLMQE